jgi:hypothetical protein
LGKEEELLLRAQETIALAVAEAVLFTAMPQMLFRLWQLPEEEVRLKTEDVMSPELGVLGQELQPRQITAQQLAMLPEEQMEMVALEV